MPFYLSHQGTLFTSRTCGGAGGAGVGADVEEARGHGTAGAEDVTREGVPPAGKRVCECSCVGVRARLCGISRVGGRSCRIIRVD